MAQPRMFISTTYEDLKETRLEIANFIKSFDYVPAVFEKQGIPFQIDTPIEDSCYDEIKNCSLFILLIKNKYGAISNYKDISNLDAINSVTQSEYKTARAKGIPINRVSA